MHFPNFHKQFSNIVCVRTFRILTSHFKFSTVGSACAVAKVRISPQKPRNLPSPHRKFILKSPKIPNFTLPPRKNAKISPNRAPPPPPAPTHKSAVYDINFVFLDPRNDVSAVSSSFQCSATITVLVIRTRPRNFFPQIKTTANPPLCI